MDALKKLFGQKEERVPQLSEIVERTGGYLTPAQMEAVMKYAKDVQALKGEDRSVADEEWMTDFVANIADVIRLDKQLDAVVKQRSSPAEDIQADDTSFKSSDGMAQETASREVSATRVRHATPTRPLPSVPNQAIKLNELASRPEKFDGKKEKAYRWLEDYEAAAEANGWSDFLKIKYLCAFMERSAKDWYAGILQPSIRPTTPWVDVKRKFLRFYVGPDELEAVREEVRRTKQMAEESVTDFIARTNRLLRQAYPDQSEFERVKEVKVRLKNIFQDKLIGQRISTLEDLTDLCLEVEKRLEISKATHKSISSKPSQYSASIDDRRESRSRRRQRQKQNKQEGRPSQVGPQPSKPVNTAGSSRFCKFCKKTGHTEDYCWAKNGKPNKTTRRTVAAMPGESSNQTLNKVATLKNTCTLIAAVTDKKNYVFHIIKLNNRRFQAMIDCGSNLSFISKEVADTLRLTPDGKDLGVRGADQRKLTCHGLVIVELQVTIKDVTKVVTTKMAVMENLCVPVLLGNQLLGLLKLEVSLAKKQVRFSREGKGARLVHDVELPPRSQTFCSAICSATVDSGASVLLTPYSNSHSLLVANGLSEVDKDGRVNCLVINLEKTKLSLAAGMQIASVEIAEPFDVTKEDHKSEAANDDEGANAVVRIDEFDEVINVGDDLNDSQIEQLRALIVENAEAFSFFGRLGETNLVEHDIILEAGTQPVVEPLRRRPAAHREEARRQTEKMLEEGVIEPSESPWASAYVLVKKKQAI